MLEIYKLFCYVNYPLFWLILRIRSLRGKEHKQRYIEKLGRGFKQRPTGEVIWVHALGLGETLSLIFFLNNLSRSFKDKTILFTTSTLNSYIAFDKLHINKNIIHQFSPVDSYIAMRKFLSFWRPSILMISELDLWPLRTIEAKKFGIPLVLFNSRMNQKKRNSRKIIYNIFKQTLADFDHIFLQDEASKKFFTYFGVSEKKLRICGPFKSAGTDLYIDKSIQKRMEKFFENKLVWIAASLHSDEEIEILEAFKLAKKKLPNLYLVMVPRSPELSYLTEKKALKYSKKVVIRKELKDFPNIDNEILIVATVGELGTWYELASIAFIGNSLDFKSIKTGKNPFEAVQSGCLVIHGPKMLEPGFGTLKDLEIAEEVSDRYEISEALAKYASPEKRKAKVTIGKKLISQNKQLIYKFINDLKTIKKGS